MKCSEYVQCSTSYTNTLLNISSPFPVVHMCPHYWRCDILSDVQVDQLNFYLHNQVMLYEFSGHISGPTSKPLAHTCAKQTHRMKSHSVVTPSIYTWYLYLHILNPTTFGFDPWWTLMSIRIGYVLSTRLVIEPAASRAALLISTIVLRHLLEVSLWGPYVYSHYRNVIQEAA